MTTVQPSPGDTTCSKRAAGATVRAVEQRVRARRGGSTPANIRSSWLEAGSSGRGGRLAPRDQLSPRGAEHERAVGERLDPELAVVPRPAVERGREIVRAVHCVPRPGGGVRERVVGRRVQDPGVAAGSVEPLARADGRVVARLRPARHQGREAAAARAARADPRASELADPVAGEAAVAEGEVASGETT